MTMNLSKWGDMTFENEQEAWMPEGNESIQNSYRAKAIWSKEEKNETEIK